KDAGLRPADTVRLCVIGAGADWLWQHVQALFPDACQVLDSYHCAEYLHKVASAPYGHTWQALEWMEATLPPLYQGPGGGGCGGFAGACSRPRTKRPKRLTTAGCISPSLAAVPIRTSGAAGATRWAVAGSHRRTNLSVMSA